MKVAMIGVGKVGSTIAYSLIFSKNVNEVLLIDKNTLEGEYIDLVQASMVSRGENIFKISSYPDIKDHIVVIAAGYGKSGVLKTDDDLYNKNRDILAEVCSNVPKTAKTILLVTNPSHRYSDIDARIIPMGSKHRPFGSCSRIIQLKGFTNWGIAAEVASVINGD